MAWCVGLHSFISHTECSFDIATLDNLMNVLAS
jgi:hypothetical protein